jgi:hypothetical protein
MYECYLGRVARRDLAGGSSVPDLRVSEGEDAFNLSTTLVLNVFGCEPRPGRVKGH